MPPLPIIVVLAAIVVFAALALVVYLRRRRAAEAKIAASMPMEQLTETDIAWRIGLLDDRPIGLSDYFAGAELSELFAGADKESVEPVVEESESPMLPAIPAAAALAAASEDAPTPAKTPKFVLKSPAAALKATAPPTAVAPAAVPVAAVAAKTGPKVSARSAPPSRRYRLYRDSATVLLGAILVVLLVTTVAPGLTAQPRPATDGPQSAMPVAIVITEPPTEAPSVEPASGQVTGPSSSPANVTSPLPAATPKATPKPTPRRTPRPTPRPTARIQATPAPTPKPTPKPTPRPTPRPTPIPDPSGKLVATCTSGATVYTFTVSNPKHVSSYSWDVDGATSHSRTFSYDYSSDPGYVEGASHFIGVTLQGPGGSTLKTKQIVAPCP